MARTNYEVTTEMAQRAALKSAMASLRAVGLYPAALMQYASVLDAVELRRELMAEQPVEDQTPVTVDDAISTACECELADPRDSIIDFWQGVSEMAAKHFTPNGEAL